MVFTVVFEPLFLNITSCYSLIFDIDIFKSFNGHAIFKSISVVIYGIEQECPPLDTLVLLLVHETAAERCSNIQRAEIKTTVKNNKKCPLYPLSELFVFGVFFSSSPVPGELLCLFFPCSGLLVTHLELDLHPVCSSHFGGLHRSSFMMNKNASP